MRKFLTYIFFIALSFKVYGEELCNNELMPENLGISLICVINYNIMPDTGENQLEKINSLVKSTSSDKKVGVYFPSGTYIVNGNIDSKKNISFIGSSKFNTIIRNNTEKPGFIGNGGSKNGEMNFIIQNFIFDNFFVQIYGSQTGVQIKFNAFINSKSKAPLITASHRPYKIHGNIFMRGKMLAGLGISNYANKTIPSDTETHEVSGNFFGSLNEIWRGIGYLDNETFNLASSLFSLRAKGIINFLDDQGYFSTAWVSSSLLENAKIHNNVIVGNSSEKEGFFNGAETVVRDHIIYAKMYDNLFIYQNRFAGWPRSAGGHVKLRNAKTLFFYANQFDDYAEFTARPYNDVDEKWQIMLDNYIFNNDFHLSVYGMWNPQIPEGKKLIVTNNNIFSNFFHHPNETYCRVSGPNRNPSAQLFGAENKFFDSGNEVKYCNNIKKVELNEIMQKYPKEHLDKLDVKAISNSNENNYLTESKPFYSIDYATLFLQNGIKNEAFVVESDNLKITDNLITNESTITVRAQNKDTNNWKDISFKSYKLFKSLCGKRLITSNKVCNQEAYSSFYIEYDPKINSDLEYGLYIGQFELNIKAGLYQKFNSKLKIKFIVNHKEEKVSEFVDVIKIVGNNQNIQSVSLKSFLKDESFKAVIKQNCTGNDLDSFIISNPKDLISIKNNKCLNYIDKLIIDNVEYKPENNGSGVAFKFNSSNFIDENLNPVKYVSANLSNYYYVNISSPEARKFVIFISDLLSRVSSKNIEFIPLHLNINANKIDSYNMNLVNLFSSLKSKSVENIFPFGHSVAYTLPLSSLSENNNNYHSITLGGNNLGGKINVTLFDAYGGEYKLQLTARSVPAACPNYATDWSLNSAVIIACGDSKETDLNNSKGLIINYLNKEKNLELPRDMLLTGNIYLQAIDWHDSTYIKNIFVKINYKLKE